MGNLARPILPYARGSIAAVLPIRSYSTLLIAEHDNQELNTSTNNVVAAAKQLPGSHHLDVLVVGDGCDAVVSEAARLDGVRKVIVAESHQLKHQMPDVVAELVHEIQSTRGYKAIAGLSGTSCKEILPRLSAKLDVQPVTDIVSVGTEHGVFTRPMYAGNAMATVKSHDDIHILSFRSTAFPAAGRNSTAAVEQYPTTEYKGAGINWVKLSAEKSDRPQLSNANRVVSGGRGLKNGENFTIVLEPLCEKLNAAMGATRAVVDAGYVPNELQVGQTGKVVAPELYFAVGISGAIQHLAGMKDSKTIVAINKDEAAPIFQIADYGLVGDLFKAVPELTDKL